MKITADTRVVVQRTVTVSTETTIGELAHDTGADPTVVIRVFSHGLGNDWIEDNHLAELVPPVSGDDLDRDEWTVTVQR